MNARAPAPPRRALRAALPFALLALALVPACSRSGQAGAGAGAAPPPGGSCGQRLVGGSWRFVGFVPDRPLPPPNAQELARLHGAVRLRFDGSRAITTGPGLEHIGPYQVYADDGASCRISAPDDSGIVTETHVRFLDPNHIEVVDQRSGVPGRATLERTGP
ncbi:MAG TPA: hypothetical protein VFS43_35125 [Polyangiaceae bacterium]|nr:hypothetical protein [Polyangiaceae bacterium]